MRLGGFVSLALGIIALAGCGSSGSVPSTDEFDRSLERAQRVFESQAIALAVGFDSRQTPAATSDQPGSPAETARQMLESWLKYPRQPVVILVSPEDTPDAERGLVYLLGTEEAGDLEEQFREVLLEGRRRAQDALEAAEPEGTITLGPELDVFAAANALVVYPSENGDLVRRVRAALGQL